MLIYYWKVIIVNSRMDKYENDMPEFKNRTQRNSKLYEDNKIDDYNKFDVNANIAILKDNAKTIDVNQIREMLDKKYRDNIPKRKSIAIETEDSIEVDSADTKEYDINTILQKAKSNKKVDYDYERFNHLDQKELNVIEDIAKKYSQESHKKESNEKELMSLINTITELEMKNKNSNDSADLLNLESCGKTDILSTKTIKNEKKQENTFYTGTLEVKEKDFEDFQEIQEDIKSNSILIKILIFILIIIIIAASIYVINIKFDLGLF